MDSSIIVNNNFNLLRLIAALQVMFVHANGYLADKSDLSQNITSILNFSGVTVFFLISGFLISMSYAKNQDLKTYIKNRILRIYPGLYVNIFISIVILYIFIDLNFDFNFFKWLLTQISFLQFYNLEASRAFGTGEINAPLWTISIELVFYAVLPIVFFINKKIMIPTGRKISINVSKKVILVIAITKPYFVVIIHGNKRIKCVEIIIIRHFK
ncbi:acyltransferase [uncultured Campylobacter sp.]|uniref:acyltransferase family protein n=1 Tax=uncultured Campylobacter sp. TaxID=218934 RepID=UPI002606FA3B|nr:acyltransferase [uncultured Campylobacter sp.]